MNNDNIVSILERIRYIYQTEIDVLKRKLEQLNNPNNIPNPNNRNKETIERDIKLLSKKLRKIKHNIIDLSN